MKKLLLLSAVLLLTACGSKLEGKYADQYSSITFNSNGKAIQSAFGANVEVNYELDGSKVKLISPQGTMVMTMLEDGSIQSPMGGKLVKQVK